MKITANKEMLLKAITTADAIVSSKSINTILGNCLFNVINDNMEIVSTDNEMVIKTKLDIISDTSISFTANGKKFADLLKTLKGNDVVIEADTEKELSLINIHDKDIKGKFSLVVTSGDDYPAIPDFNEKQLIEIEQNLLKDMIKKVVYAASHDTIKPIFNGVFFNIENENELTTVATDSRRLSMITRKLDAIPNLNTKSFILPLKTVSEVLRILGSTGNCKFAFNNKQCFFNIGDTEIISRVVEGQFPNYKHVIPPEHIIDTVIETEKLMNTVKRVMIFTREPVNKLVCMFDNSNLAIEADTPDLGTGAEEIEINSVSGGSLKIGVNAQFLLECLREIDSPNVKCGLTGNMSPITFSPENDDTYVSVVMPIQIKVDD